MENNARRAAGISALVLSGIAGLGAASVVAHQRYLNSSLSKVQPGLRALLLVRTHKNIDIANDADFFQSMRQSQKTFGASGLGRQQVIESAIGEIKVWIYETKTRKENGLSGALIWMHGGGLVSGSAAQDHALCSRIARELGCLVISVEYRLAPEFPYPSALDDCFEVLNWLHTHANALDVDPQRIAVGGSSAGGGLAAATAQRALDADLPVVFQLLFYPMLDDRTGANGMQIPGRGEFMWTAEANVRCWRAYLGHEPGEAETRPWCVPARRKNLDGLPAAWIGVGDLDLFLDEDLNYAQALQAAGTATQVRVEPGMYHCADVCTWSGAMRSFRSEAVDALGRALRTAS